MYRVLQLSSRHSTHLGNYLINEPFSFPLSLCQQLPGVALRRREDPSTAKYSPAAPLHVRVLTVVLQPPIAQRVLRVCKCLQERVPITQVFITFSGISQVEALPPVFKAGGDFFLPKETFQPQILTTLHKHKSNCTSMCMVLGVKPCTSRRVFLKNPALPTEQVPNQGLQGSSGLVPVHLSQ